MNRYSNRVSLTLYIVTIVKNLLIFVKYKMGIWFIRFKNKQFIEKTGHAPTHSLLFPSSPLERYAVFLYDCLYQFKILGDSFTKFRKAAIDEIAILSDLRKKQLQGEGIATAAIIFYEFPPTYTNKSGRKGYITNMYTNPNYRKRGLATLLLDNFVNEAKKRNVEKNLAWGFKDGTSRLFEVWVPGNR